MPWPEMPDPHATHAAPASGPALARGGWYPWQWSLAWRVVVAVLAGIAVGAALRDGGPLAEATASTLGLLRELVIRLILLLVSPLIFFAIIDTFVQTNIAGRLGAKLVLVCLVNVAFAFAIGLTIMNGFRPGEAWSSHLPEMIAKLGGNVSAKEPPQEPPSLSPLVFVRERLVPRSIAEPFVNNQVLPLVFMAILVGLALRNLRHVSGAAGAGATRLAQGAEACFHLLMYLLQAIIEWVPLAVFGAVVQAAAQLKSEALLSLWVFLATILGGLAVHALVYYPLAVWIVSGRPPWVFFRAGAEAILTGMFTNSSLATVPVTLRSLGRLGVSEPSARLSTCVATNFNNDGITLYEAMAALFLAQALRQQLTLLEQGGILLASIMAAISITGVPEAGIIVLPLVLAAAGMSETTLQAALVLLFPLDVIVARARSAVNVTGDMAVALLLDGRGSPAPPVP